MSVKIMENITGRTRRINLYATIVKRNRNNVMPMVRHASNNIFKKLLSPV